MREAGDEDLPSDVQDREKRRRLAAQLTGEMGLIRREFESTGGMKSGARFLYDFEKHLPFRHQEIRYASVSSKSREEKTVDESSRIRMAAEYAAEAGVLAVMDVLRHSKKVVFSKDWEVGYREDNVIGILQKIEKKRRRKGLVRSCEGAWIDKRDVENTWKRMVDAESKRMNALKLVSHEIALMKRSRVVCVNASFRALDEARAWDPEDGSTFGMNGEEEVVTYRRTKIVKTDPSEGVSRESVVLPLMRDDNPPTILNVRTHDSPKKKERALAKTQMIERYKRYLRNFSKMNAKRSSRNSFNIAQTSASSHPTSQHVFKKIPMEYLRCKNARDIVNYKYKHVVIGKETRMAGGGESGYSPEGMQDGLSGDLCSSGSDDTSIRYTFLIEAALGKTPDSGRKDILEADMERASMMQRDKRYIYKVPAQVPLCDGDEGGMDTNVQTRPESTENVETVGSYRSLIDSVTQEPKDGAEDGKDEKV
ncbi:hypothetical protein EHEL_030870 [Encephalitozoon hellem ATCC 50504]|nr:uncharacterized protein EHEL_030870 [Encephalitozoon hellem ATCC 50504]AFM97984.2 hypothetical protein EHEL_030870 [Encephalitozoon hellem ATCC 50504]